MKMYIRSKCIIKKTGNPVWFDNHCRKAATRKRHLFKKLKENNTQENRDKFAESRWEFNHVDKKTRRYNNKLKEDLPDGSLSSKKWWNTVNTLTTRMARSDIPVL